MDNDDFKNDSLRGITGGRSEQASGQDILRELGKLLGGGGGGGGGRSGTTKGSDVSPFFIIIAGLLLIGAFTSFYTVDVSEEAVVTRFKRYHETTPPGLHFKIPFGVDQVTKVPSKVLLQEEFGFRSQSQGRISGQTQYAKQGFAVESLMLTGDLNVADVEWIVQYRISDPWKFLFHTRNVQRNVRDVSMSIMRRVVGDRLVGDVLTVGRVEIAEEAKKLTQEVLDRYDIGIAIVAVVLQDVNPPEAVKSAFNDVNSAKQEQEKAVNVAEREYNNIIPEAKGKAEQVIADAEAFAVSLINNSKGDAAKFSAMLKEYQLAPDVTRRRMYIEAMENIFSKLNNLIVVDSKIKGVLPLYPTTEGSLLPSTSSARGGKN